MWWASYCILAVLALPLSAGASTCHVCSGPVGGAPPTLNRPKRESPGKQPNWTSLYGNQEYYLGVLLASRAGTIFDYEKVLPAIEIAVEKANAFILPAVNCSFRLMRAAYGNNCFPDGATGRAAEFIRDANDSKLLAFVGPACSDALDHVARLGAYLNITVVSGLGDERQFVDKTHFATLSRFAYCQCRLRRVVSAMLDRFNWTHVAILYDINDYFSKTIGQSIDEGLREPAIGARLNMTPFVEFFESQRDPNYGAMLKRASEEARSESRLGGGGVRLKDYSNPFSHHPIGHWRRPTVIHVGGP